jgi:hypothetical protein
MSLPVPVNLNRFLAPECVFIFGMWIHFFRALQLQRWQMI